MSRRCYCKYCGRPTNCQADICEVCALDRSEDDGYCPNGGHCDIRLEEVKPSVWKYQGEDGKYYLKRE